MLLGARSDPRAVHRAVTMTMTIHLSLTTNMINVILNQHPLYPFTATGEVDRGREARTAFLALLRLEAAFINIRAFARARQKPNMEGGTVRSRCVN